MRTDQRVSQYDESYFLAGKKTGKSLYENYRWMPDLTIPMVQRIIDHCSIVKGVDRVLDFGCARGYVVRAFRELGFDSFGFDVSEWAIENCDPQVEEFVSSDPLVGMAGQYDWIIAKDVLEHIEYVTLTIADLMRNARKGVFVVVPLSPFDRTPYAIEEYEKDVTHVQRLSLMTWASMFMLPGWSVQMQYRLPGIKDNWYKPGWDIGNGFITARRVGE